MSAENHETVDPTVAEDHNSANGNGSAPKPDELPAIWDDKAHFVLRSAEETLVLRPEADVELTAIVVPRRSAERP